MWWGRSENFDEDEPEKELTSEEMEKQNKEAIFDKDGQPLYKVMKRDITGKQELKFGKQAKDEGIRLLQRPVEMPTEEVKEDAKKSKSKKHSNPVKDNFVSFIRGSGTGSLKAKAACSVVQLYDAAKNEIVCSRDYKGVLKDQIQSLIVYKDGPNNFKNLVVDKLGNVVLDQFSRDDFKSKKSEMPKLDVHFKALGDDVTCMKHNPHNISQVVLGSKDQLLQLWDINNADKPVWVARNLPNDELSLQIPIWDVDVEWLSRTNAHSLVTCTAYCDVREYDIRRPRKPVMNT